MPDKTAIRNKMRGILDPVVKLLVALDISPLAITIAGLILSLGGALVIARGSLRWGAGLLLISGLCDTLDGTLARRTGRETKFGAFIDSTIDRVTELASFGALIIYFGARGENGDAGIILSLVAIVGSFLTSYTRARAEGLGLECRVGLLERPERVAILVIGLLAGGAVLIVALGCLAVFSVVTSCQRIRHVYRLTAKRDAAEER